MMIITQKITSLAYEIHDGKTLGGWGQDGELNCLLLMPSPAVWNISHVAMFIFTCLLTGIGDA